MLRGLALCVACAVLPAAHAASEPLNRGHLIVHKRLTAPDTKDILVQNERAVITYTLMNVGDGDVTDISLVDPFPEEMFSIVSGSDTIQLAKLEAGTNYTSELVLIPRVHGTMTPARADVLYRFTIDGQMHEAKAQSSTPSQTRISQRTEYDVQSADHSVAIGGAFVTAVALVLWPFQTYRTAFAAKKQS